MRSIRRIICFAFAALLAALFSLCAAAQTTEYDVWVNGTRVSSENASGIRCGLGTASYSPENNVLTLNEAVITKIHEETGSDGGTCGAIYASGDITIELIGENTVASVFSLGHNVVNCGIRCEGTLTFTGTGSLTVTGGLSTYQTIGIYADALIVSDSVTVNACGGRLTSSVGTSGFGIYSVKDVTFTENAEIQAISFLHDSEYLPSVSESIYAGGLTTIEKNAVVSATANRSADESGEALMLNGMLSVSGGSLKAKAVGENGIGIKLASHGGSALQISSGFIYATGGQYALFSSYGKCDVHPEYNITGASFYNASEAGCQTDASLRYDNGYFYAVTENNEINAAKSVYFVRPVKEYGLWLGDTRVNNYNCTDIFGDGKISYDKDTHTLTMNGAQISGGRYKNAYIYAEDTLTILLSDGSANTVGGFSHETTDTSYGIYAANGLSVSGGGSLVVASGDAQNDAFGIYVRIGSFSVKGSSLQAKAGNAGTNSAGIYVASKASGDLSVSEIASVTAASGKAATMIGISANGKISVTEASSLSGEGGSDRSNESCVSYGIRSGGAVDLDDSSAMTGLGGSSGSFSIGVYALGSDDGITVRGGTLTAQSGAGANKCYGLFAKTSVTVKGGALYALSREASDAPDGKSYAVTGKNVTFGGGTIHASSSKAKGSCGIYADTLFIAGSTEITVSSYGGHAFRKAPKYSSYAPVVYAGDEEPGALVIEPKEATYVNSAYIRIEKLFKSERIWYALPFYDGAGKYANRWIGFSSDDVSKVAQIGSGVEFTGAAEYYNGYIYGVTNALPFRFWRVKLDGANIGSPEFISDSVRFSFGDMSYDYVTDQMYGLGTFNMERAVFSIDVYTGESKRVVSVSGTDADLLTLAFNRAGECYGIDLSGCLYRISLTTGKAIKIGDTGLIPDGAQSMAFDRDTNELFWAYFNGQTGRSGFYYVDVRTGEAFNTGRIGGNHMELSGLLTIPSQYDVWVGGTRVNEENFRDVFGNGSVSFDPDNKTLTFNNAAITAFAQAYKNYSFGVLAKDMDLTLICNGTNTIALDGVYTDYSSSVCVVNGKTTIKGGKLTILNTTARLDNTILCPLGLTVEDCELMVNSNHNGITVNENEADILIRGSTVGINAGHIGMAATGGSIFIENSTVAISADKDERIKACAAAAQDALVLKDSSLYASADTNIALIASVITVTESTVEAAAGEQAVSGNTQYLHKNGSAVTVAETVSEEDRANWDKNTDLTQYRYIKIAECSHEYDGPADTECNLCGHIRSVTPDGETYVPGDVDGDGKITSADARLALRRAVGLEEYPETGAQYYACDVDSDRKVTAADARLILRASVGLEIL